MAMRQALESAQPHFLRALQGVGRCRSCRWRRRRRRQDDRRNVFFLGLNFFLVAFRRERRRNIVAQNDGVNAARSLLRDAGKIGKADRRTDVRARRKENVFAAFIENRVAGVAETVGDLSRLIFVERIKKNRAQAIVELFRISQPAAVRRPRRL
jgi:hypothetical protein